MTDILQIYQELYAPRQEYCVLCFRSGKERKLGAKSWLRELAAGLGGRDEFSQDFQKLCFVCMARVKSALRVVDTLRVARAAHVALRAMATRQARGGTLTSPAGTWPSALRGSGELVQTEVLAFSCGGEADVFVLPDAPPSSPPSEVPRLALAPRAPTVPRSVTRQPMITLLPDPSNGSTTIVTSDVATSLTPLVLTADAPPPPRDVTSILLNRLLADYNLPPTDSPDAVEQTSPEERNEAVAEDAPAKRPRKREEEKRPQEGATDWEDKIPMDVISFMNATDPNAASVLAPTPPTPPALLPRPETPSTPPIAVISAVRSTRDNEPTNDNSAKTIPNPVTRNCEVTDRTQSINGESQTVDCEAENETQPLRSGAYPVYRNVRPVLGGWRGRRGRRMVSVGVSAGGSNAADAPCEVIDLC